MQMKPRMPLASSRRKIAADGGLGRIEKGMD
jgi:hypothetical protein